jgi:hypothetical protein
MSGEDTDDMLWFDVELADRETFFIGKVVALWSALEHEVFWQTLMSFGLPDSGDIALPKEMNNMQFSQVLELWKTRVVDKTQGNRSAVLQQQYTKIRHYYDFRNALVHGMWDWSKSAPEKITAIRIRRQEMITTQFTADDLESFASQLHSINFKVRYPGGQEDYVNSFVEQGSSHVSRRAVCLMTRNPLTDDLFPSCQDIHGLVNQPEPDDETGTR